MREADRQKSREERDRLLRRAEHIVKTAHEMGGEAKIVTGDCIRCGEPALKGAFGGIPAHLYPRFKHEVEKPLDE